MSGCSEDAVLVANSSIQLQPAFDREWTGESESCGNVTARFAAQSQYWLQERRHLRHQGLELRILSQYGVQLVERRWIEIGLCKRARLDRLDHGGRARFRAGQGSQGR